MKLFVKVDGGQWNALPCGDGESKVGWIASEMKTRLCLEADAVDLKCHVRTKNGKSCQLNASDRIKDVLENNDFVQIGKCSSIFFRFHGSLLFGLVLKTTCFQREFASPLMFFLHFSDISYLFQF